MLGVHTTHNASSHENMPDFKNTGVFSCSSTSSSTSSSNESDHSIVGLSINNNNHVVDDVDNEHELGCDHDPSSNEIILLQEEERQQDSLPNGSDEPPPLRTLRPPEEKKQKKLCLLFPQPTFFVWNLSYSSVSLLSQRRRRISISNLTLDPLYQRKQSFFRILLTVFHLSVQRQQSTATSRSKNKHVFLERHVQHHYKYLAQELWNNSVQNDDTSHCKYKGNDTFHLEVRLATTVLISGKQLLQLSNNEEFIHLDYYQCKTISMQQWKHFLNIPTIPPISDLGGQNRHDDDNENHSLDRNSPYTMLSLYHWWNRIFSIMNTHDITNITGTIPPSPTRTTTNNISIFYHSPPQTLYDWLNLFCQYLNDFLMTYTSRGFKTVHNIMKMNHDNLSFFNRNVISNSAISLMNTYSNAYDKKEVSAENKQKRHNTKEKMKQNTNDFLKTKKSQRLHHVHSSRLLINSKFVGLYNPNTSKPIVRNEYIASSSAIADMDLVDDDELDDNKTDMCFSKRLSRIHRGLPKTKRLQERKEYDKQPPKSQKKKRKSNLSHDSGNHTQAKGDILCDIENSWAFARSDYDMGLL